MSPCRALIISVLVVEGLGRGLFLDAFIALSLDLWWKGEFDDIEFTIFLYFLGMMTHQVEEDIVLDTHENDTIVADDPLAWVMLEPRNNKLCFSQDASDAFNVPEVRAEGSPANWVLQIPHLNRRICSAFPETRFPMYEFALKEAGMRLPFNDFQVEVFQWLQLAPSQLHRNALAFMRAFELVCQYL